MQPEVAQTGAVPETEAPTRFGSFSALKQRLKEVKQSTVGRLTQQQKQSNAPDVQQQEGAGHRAQDDDDNSSVFSETSSLVQKKLEQLLRPAAAAGPSTIATGNDAGVTRGSAAAQAGGSGGLNLTVRRFKAPIKLPGQQGPSGAESSFFSATTPGFARSASTVSSASAASTAAPADGASAARPHLRISLNGSLSRGTLAAVADTADTRSGLNGQPATAARTAADKGVARMGSRSARSEAVADNKSRSNSDVMPAAAGDASAPVIAQASRRRSILDPISIVVPGAQDVSAVGAAGSATVPGSTSTAAMKRLSSSGRPADAASSLTVGNSSSSSSQPASTAAPAGVASGAAECAGLLLQLPASKFKEHSRDGSAAAAAAAPHTAQQPTHQHTRAVATGPHIFAAFQVPAHLYNSQEDILNDTDIQELLGKVEQCVGAKEHPRIHWHMRTSSMSSLGAEIATAAPAGAAAKVQIPADTPPKQETTTAGGAHQSLSGSVARQIHVHVDEQDDGQLSVIISDMEDPDSSVLLLPDVAYNAAAARTASLARQHTVLEVTASEHGSTASGVPPVGGFSLAARRSSASGGPTGLGLSSRASSVTGMRPTIGSMIAARISISDCIPAAVSQQQGQQAPAAVALPAAAAAREQLQKSTSVRSTVRPSRRSIDAHPVIVGLSSAALAAAEEHQQQQQQPPEASSLHASATPEHAAAAAAAANGAHFHGVAVQRVHSTVSNDDASDCCDSQSDLSLLANPLHFVDTLRQRMSQHLWTPAAAAAASGGEQGTASVAAECASPSSTALRTAQQLDEYFKGHESLQRKAARFKLNLQQRQQQKQQLNHTVANPTTAAAAAAADPAGARILLSRTIGGPAGHLNTRLGHNAPVAAAAAGTTKQRLYTRPAKVLVPGAATSAATPAASSENDSSYNTYPPISPTASTVAMGSGLTAAVNSLLQRHEQQQLGPGVKSSKGGAGSVVGIGANSASSSVPVAVIANAAVSGPLSSLGVRQLLLRPATTAAATSNASVDEGGGAGLNVEALRQDLEACLRKVG